MRIVTWNRDSHGLFDYESKDRDRVQQEFKSNTGALIQRSATGDVTLENPFVKASAIPAPPSTSTSNIKDGN